MWNEFSKTQESFPKHLHIGTARMKYDKETEEGKKRHMGMERSKACTKKSPNCQSLQNKNIIIIINIIWYVVFYKILKTYNEIQLTKNKMDQNNQKIKNNSPSLSQIDNILT